MTRIDMIQSQNRDRFQDIRTAFQQNRRLLSRIPLSAFAGEASGPPSANAMKQQLGTSS
jgi:hypothetical protein